jgi:hypothetical protein
MTTATIRPAYDMWPQYNRRMCEVIREMSSEQLAVRPSPELWRLFSHDAYHCGELSQTLGLHGLPQIDLWRPD